MALGNIGGDLCYLGFAFNAQGWVSYPKLAGFLFTFVAHSVLLAFADSQILAIEQEKGCASATILWLRHRAQSAFVYAPPKLLFRLRAKPVGIAFGMLCFNGAGLVVDALMKGSSFAALTQTALGLGIILGCSCFAWADWVKSQKVADRLLKLGPFIFTLVTLMNGLLFYATRDGFLALSLILFMTANWIGFYTKISKENA